MMYVGVPQCFEKRQLAAFQKKGTPTYDIMVD
jgi:hypothetical protein